jgi:hypothetical protein
MESADRAEALADRERVLADCKASRASGDVVVEAGE